MSEMARDGARPAGSGRARRLHPLPVRIMHWLNALAMIAIPARMPMSVMPI